MKNLILTMAAVASIAVGWGFAEERTSDFQPGPATLKQLPEGSRGFAGMITAQVVSKGNDQIVVEVTKIDRAWKHSRAENAQSLVGNMVAIKIVPSLYEKKPGYLDRVRAFFASLKPGDAKAFDVKYGEGDSLIFLELTEDQAAQVEVRR